MRLRRIRELPMDKLRWAVAALMTVLVALTGVAVHSLLLLGSTWLAVVVAVGGIVAMAAVGAAYSTAREAEAQVADFQPTHPAPVPQSAPRQAFRVREARPGEIPAPYLAAVMKGTQATRAALRARDLDP
jgi:hypothetical protein